MRILAICEVCGYCNFSIGFDEVNNQTVLIPAMTDFKVSGNSITCPRCCVVQHVDDSVIAQIIGKCEK